MVHLSGNNEFNGKKVIIYSQDTDIGTIETMFFPEEGVAHTSVVDPVVSKDVPYNETYISIINQEDISRLFESSIPYDRLDVPTHKKNKDGDFVPTGRKIFLNEISSLKFFNSVVGPRERDHISYATKHDDIHK